MFKNILKDNNDMIIVGDDNIDTLNYGIPTLQLQ